MSTSSSSATLPMNPSDWQQYFPKKFLTDGEQKRLGGNDAREFQGHWLKWMVVWRSERQVLKAIQTLKDLGQLRSKMQPLGFTVLHIATLKGRVGVLKGLLKAGADPKTKDAKGWTAYHLSAFGGRAVGDVFRSFGKGLACLTRLNGTAIDILQLMGVRESVSSKVIEYRHPEDGFESLNIPKLRQLIGSNSFFYSDTCRISMLGRVDYWKTKSDVQDPDALHSRDPRARALLTVGPQEQPCFLRSNRYLEKRLGKDAPIFAAASFVPAAEGRYLGDYVGMLTDTATAPSWSQAVNADRCQGDYVLNGIDSRERGNWTRFINDGGLPNCAVVKIAKVAGLAIKSVVISIQDLATGQQLFRNYGLSDPALKWGQFVIAQSRRDIRDYYATHPPMNLLVLYQRGLNDLESTPTERLLGTYAWTLQSKERFLWPLHTPAVLIDLVCSQSVSLEKWRVALETELAAQSMQLYPEHRVWMGKLMELLERFMEATERSPAGGFARLWVIGQIGQLKVVQLVEAMNRICDYLHLMPADGHRAAWPVIASMLQKEMPKYEWDADPSFVFADEEDAEVTDSSSISSDAGVLLDLTGVWGDQPASSSSSSW